MTTNDVKLAHIDFDERVDAIMSDGKYQLNYSFENKVGYRAM